MKDNQVCRFYRPHLEALEGRELPAATVSLQAGFLRIIGNGRDDTVIVTRDDGLIRVQQANGVRRDRVFSAAAVNQIFFRGFDGDDIFLNNTAIPSQAFGNRGRDLLQGGPALDQLFGGAGRDRLLGDVFDLLDGGLGRDRVFRDLAADPTLFDSVGTGGFDFGVTSSALLGGFGTGIPFPGSQGATTPGLTSLVGGLSPAMTSPSVLFSNPIGLPGLSAANSPPSDPSLTGTLGNPFTPGLNLTGGLGTFF
jgi:Ca2+-binding RTX toxin-like protein